MKTAAKRPRGDFFPSRRDRWLALLIWGPFIGILPLLLITTATGSISPLLIVLAVYGFVGWIWFGTGYALDRKELLIQSGPLRWRIKLSDIDRVRETRNLSPSAALAIERLEIRYSDFGRVYIAPKDRERFLDVIARRCPRAEIERST